MRHAILTLLLLLFIRLPGYSEGGKMLVTMRKVGHEVLLASGDSTSWVLPIEQVDNHTFLIRFERPFAFTPASLVETIQRHIPELDYLVEVRQEQSNTVVYSYEVRQPLHRKSIACLSRTPPRGDYSIQIQFADPPVQIASVTSAIKFAWLLLPVLLVGFGWRLFRRKRPAAAKPVTPTTLVHLGPLTFCRETQVLRLGDERIELSAKESKLLNVFVGAPNTVIDRSQLMKQVWEDEGVFVGRSLDVFVSRLRKKLQPAPTVRLVNSHGRGYKLEIDSPHG
ncbi:transcriptional regulator [Siphonobacter sp. BAB-5405]|uniref:winged helix-turn-helix domain-containing protein n=1 Tax=Siphonobacter sp. BAB-5405 TaxID=1864825 RepID=UPI000C803236|nr:winged helix-turn-helix domain-containing protein [Siphonobacter sp. BAB-5405]PMD90730.1 transcriptional regulator [Siphonobacter sp. BAB-5405]